MKVALFNGFSVHFECMGSYIHYCKERGLDYTVYILPKHKHRWPEFFKTYLDPNMKTEYPHMDEEDISKYDKIIILNDDEIFLHERFNTYPQMIVIDHGKGSRRPKVPVHLETRPHSNCDMKYVYSLVPWLTKEKKKEILNKENQINLVIVGGHYHKLDLLNKLKADWNNVKLFVISRKIKKEDFSNIKNIEFVEDCDTFKMYDIVSKCHYLLFVDVQPHLIVEAVSSSVGMCFSNLCVPIMTKEYNSIYKFKSPIYFEDEPQLDLHLNIDIVDEDLQAMLKNNKESLDSVLN